MVASPTCELIRVDLRLLLIGVGALVLWLLHPITTIALHLRILTKLLSPLLLYVATLN